MPVTILESLSEFRRAIAQSKLSVVDFYAVWCGPCKAIAPRFEQLSNNYPGVNFYKVNVDNLAEVAREHGVMAMPTFKIFRTSKLIDTIVGANMNELESKVRNHATPPAFSGKGHRLGSATSPTSPSVAASTASSAFASIKGDKFPITTNTTGTGSVTTSMSSTSTWVWIVVAFLTIYWWNLRRQTSTDDPGLEF